MRVSNVTTSQRAKTWGQIFPAATHWSFMDLFVPQKHPVEFNGQEILRIQSACGNANLNVIRSHWSEPRLVQTEWHQLLPGSLKCWFLSTDDSDLFGRQEILQKRLHFNKIVFWTRFYLTLSRLAPWQRGRPKMILRLEKKYFGYI